MIEEGRQGTEERERQEEEKKLVDKGEREAGEERWVCVCEVCEADRQEERGE